MKSSWLYKLAMVLTIVGGLNWGLMGFFDFNLVEMVFGSVEMLPTIVYDLVGLSALYMAVACLSCNSCK